MGNVKIYCLKDPRDLSIRYIGKTVTPLYDRLKVHIHQSKITSKHTHKEAWIKQLILINLKPVIELIEEVDESHWVEREKYWISFYKGLTNLSIGGDGPVGVRHTEEWKEQLRQRMKGNSQGLGIKWTEEQKRLRRLTPPWNKGIKTGKGQKLFKPIKICVH